MLNQELHKLAETLNLIEYEETEPFILTVEEQQRAIEHAIVSAKQHASWKMAQILKTQDEIFLKLSEIDWNKRIDHKRVLRLANTAKLQEQWQAEQAIKRKVDPVEHQKKLQEFWNYKRVYVLMKWNSENLFGKAFRQTDDNLPTIKAICFFISRDNRFMSEFGYSAQKGLLIRGPSGTGKTHLVRCIENNELNPILTKSMLEITDQIKDSGDYRFSLNGQKIIYLDDVGTEEPVVNFFGTKISFFKNFIEGIYLKTKIFNHLIVSTNLNFKGIEEYYGFRVASRMREMFNVVDLKGKDLRNEN